MKKVEIITRLKGIAETRLEKRVLNNILKSTDDYNNESFVDRLNGVFKDYSQGCSTGAVSELISYKQTNRFFDTYRTEILELLQDDINDGLFEILEMENDYNWIIEKCIRFNNSDVKIALNHDNTLKSKKYNMEQKNILAWYAFERCIFRFIDMLEEI